MRFTFTALVLSASLAFALPADRRIVEKRSSAPPSSWKRSTIAPSPSTKIPLQIGLTQQNLDKLDQVLLEVSNPDSDKYSQHWSKEDVIDFFKPKESTKTAVREWLMASGINGKSLKNSLSQSWIMVDLELHQVEKLLNAKYYEYTHENTGVKTFACDEYSVPRHIREHIDMISPTTAFDHPDAAPKAVKRAEVDNEKRSVVPQVAKKLGQPNNNGNLPKVAPAGFTGQYAKVFQELNNCANVTTLDCLRIEYNFAGYRPVNSRKNAFGIVEYTPQAVSYSDLDIFFRNYSQSQVGQRPIVRSIDNGFVQTTMTGFDYNGESNLDFQYGMGLTEGIPVNLYQVGDEVQGASFNNFLDGIDASYCTYEGGDDPTQDGIYPANVNCGVAPLSSVISTSYGYNEADLTPAYENRQCNEYAKLGLMGVTIVYSSGDYGVAGNSGQCLEADGTLSVNGTRFNPAFPSTCPYVTSVGATQIPPGGNVLSPQEACQTVIYSGGGFSNVFPMPSYQSAAVKSYFRNHLPPYTAAQYNNSQMTRGYPDLSANGANYLVVIQGQPGLVYGTSASAPVVASILTLINDARGAIFKKPIGFINPTIYSNLFKAGFNDIVSGGNQGCGTPGFTAVQGWDPVTGLGTPNFAALLPLWLALP